MKRLFSKKENIIICVLMIFILVLNVCIGEMYKRQPTSIFLLQPCVPDEETATDIAQIMCKVQTGIEVEKEAFKAYEADNRWQVVIKGRDAFDSRWSGSYDGGVYINKQDCTITSVNFLKQEIDEYYRLKEEYESP